MGTQFIKPSELRIGRVVKTIENGKRLSVPRVIESSSEPKESSEKKVTIRSESKGKPAKRPQCKATKRDSKQCTAQSCEGHEFCKRHLPKHMKVI